jgi:hypothetical protein
MKACNTTVAESTQASIRHERARIVKMTCRERERGMDGAHTKQECSAGAAWKMERVCMHQRGTIHETNLRETRWRLRKQWSGHVGSKGACGQECTINMVRGRLSIGFRNTNAQILKCKFWAWEECGEADV